jgi:hypothetical protein
MNIFSQILKGIYIVYTKKKKYLYNHQIFIQLFVGATFVLTTFVKK